MTSTDPMYKEGFLDGANEMYHLLKMNPNADVEDSLKHMNPQNTKNKQYVSGFTDAVNKIYSCSKTSSFDKCAESAIEPFFKKTKAEDIDMFKEGYLDGVDRMGRQLQINPNASVEDGLSHMNHNYAQNSVYVRGFTNATHQMYSCAKTTPVDKCVDSLVGSFEKGNEHFNLLEANNDNNHVCLVIILIIILVIWWRLEHNVIRSI